MLLTSLPSLGLAAENEKISEIFRLMNNRLGHMEDVALYKVHHGIPIEDLHREEIVLANAVEFADSFGLQREPMAVFFQQQMNIAKAIQYRYRALWLSKPSSGLPKDLNSEIRPQLDELSTQIVSALADYLASASFNLSSRDSFFALITQDRVSLDEKQALFDALLALRLNSAKK